MPAVVSMAEYRTGPIRLLMLVRRVAAEDRGAFTRLYDALVVQVSATVRDILADPVRVDMVTSATFVEAWRSAGCHTAPGTDVAAWITSVAIRRAREPCPVGGSRHPSTLDDPVDAVELAALMDRRFAGRRSGGGRGRG